MDLLTTFWRHWGQGHSVPLKSLLVRLAVICILPFACVAGYLAYLHVIEDRTLRSRDIEARLSNIVGILDARIHAQIAALQALADSTHADSAADLPSLYEEAIRARATFDGHIALADTSMRLLFNTRERLGTPLPRLVHPQGFAAAPTALASGKPAVGNLFHSLVGDVPTVAIAVPIVRHSEVTGLVIGTLETVHFQRVLEGIGLAAGWAMDLIDGNGALIARRTEWAAQPDTTFTGVTSHMRNTPWTIALSIPASDLNQTTYRTITAAAVGIAVAILLSTLTWLIASRVIGRALLKVLTPQPYGMNGSPGIVEFENVGDALRQTSHHLRESEARYEQLFMANTQPMWVTDMETLRFTAVNNAAVDHYGYSREEFGRMTVPDIHPVEDHEKLAAQVAGMPAGIYRPGIMTHIRKDGSRISVEITVHPMQFAGRSSALVCATDVTQRLAAEESSRDYLARIERSLIGTVEAVSKIVEIRDPYTAGHEERVGDLAAAIADEMGLDGHTQRGLKVAGRMHDIGKIGVPADILTRPRELTAIEHSMVQTHAERGYEVLKNVQFPWPVAEVALQHHERLDGSGYPHGLKGNDIIIEARIMAVADVVESMSSHRPYRPAPGLDAALAHIQDARCALYDPEVVDACLRLFRERHYDMRIPA